MPESHSRAPLVWIDCEMTGLDAATDTIMSLACFVTDADLNFVDPQGHSAIIHHSDERLAKMGEWCIEHHGASGLTAACVRSTTTADGAAKELLAYIKQHVPRPRQGLLAGNSIHSDKMFLMQEPYAPIVEYLHYRMLDVSTIKEAAKRWAPPSILAQIPKKAGKHEAKADILESIEEARFYQKAFFAHD